MSFALQIGLSALQARLCATGFRDTTRIASSSPEEVSMMPMPPALETAEASCARAIDGDLDDVGRRGARDTEGERELAALRLHRVGRRADLHRNRVLSHRLGRRAGGDAASD